MRNSSPNRQSKIRVRYFQMPYNVLRVKKSKIVTITAMSIWVRMPHIELRIIIHLYTASQLVILHSTETYLDKN